MRKILMLVSMAFCCMNLHAQNLKFNEQHEFTIMQLTDMHLDPSKPRRLVEAQKTFERMNRLIEIEKPDLIVLTGDVVTGPPATQMWNRLLDSLNRHQIPFCVVLGNHDAEQDISRAEIGRLVCSSPYSLNALTEKGELADMELCVKEAHTPKTALALYCMDSHDNSPMEQIHGYGWFTWEQVAWLRDRCLTQTALAGGKPIPSLAFFHIVLHEYLSAWRNPDNTHIGRCAEDECPGALNTGMFAAMVETGSVMGTFVGHDHDIDYMVAEKGICMGYGRFSGDNTTYNDLRPGARIIKLTEGERGFESWIREGDGRMVDHVIFSNGRIKEIFVER